MTKEESGRVYEDRDTGRTKPYRGLIGPWWTSHRNRVVILTLVVSGLLAMGAVFVRVEYNRYEATLPLTDKVETTVAPWATRGEGNTNRFSVIVEAPGTVEENTFSATIDGEPSSEEIYTMEGDYEGQVLTVVSVDVPPDRTHDITVQVEYEKRNCFLLFDCTASTVEVVVAPAYVREYRGEVSSYLGIGYFDSGTRAGHVATQIDHGTTTLRVDDQPEMRTRTELFDGVDSSIVTREQSEAITTTVSGDVRIVTRTNG